MSIYQAYVGKKVKKKIPKNLKAKNFYLGEVRGLGPESTFCCYTCPILGISFPTWSAFFRRKEGKENSWVVRNRVIKNSVLT